MCVIIYKGKSVIEKQLDGSLENIMDYKTYRTIFYLKNWEMQVLHFTES